MDLNKKKKKKNTEITDLPKDLVPQILSWLPTQTAVRVSYLFLRGSWKIDMKDLSKLKFCFYSEDEDVDHFVRFVDQVLLLRGGNRNLKGFSLKIYDEVDEEAEAVTRWVDYALENGVEKLTLKIISLYGYFHLKPSVFVQKTLVSLKLAATDRTICIYENGVTAIDLPLLKTLWLDDIDVENDATFVRLIASCTVLEELVMKDMRWQRWDDCFVASATLRRLKIMWSSHVEMNRFIRCPQSVSFDTPSLLYLEYADHIARIYPVLSFDSLVEAEINLKMLGAVEQEDIEDEEDYDEDEMIVGDDATEFFMGINLVRILHLSPSTIQILLNCHAIPEFKNLTDLTIQSSKGSSWDVIPELLTNCPRLETLVLDGLFHLATDGCGDVCPCRIMDASCLENSPVRVLKVYEVVTDDENVPGPDTGEVIEDETRFVNQVRHLLLRMPHLQHVKIYGQTEKSMTVLREIATQLRRLEGKASPDVQILVLPA